MGEDSGDKTEEPTPNKIRGSKKRTNSKEPRDYIGNHAIGVLLYVQIGWPNDAKSNFWAYNHGI